MYFVTVKRNRVAKALTALLNYSCINDINKRRYNVDVYIAYLFGSVISYNEISDLGVGVETGIDTTTALHDDITYVTNARRDDIFITNKRTKSAKIICRILNYIVMTDTASTIFQNFDVYLEYLYDMVKLNYSDIKSLGVELR